MMYQCLYHVLLSLLMQHDVQLLYRIEVVKTDSLSTILYHPYLPYNMTVAEVQDSLPDYQIVF